MADSFFGFDTSISNLNDDDEGGDGSEDEYDALNDETFGHGTDELDWELEHEQLAHQLESSRRPDTSIDDLANSQLEASLSQLVLDETDAPRSRALGSSVWRHDPPPQPPMPPPMKNVCTVEELERQLRQNQHPQFNNQTYFQPRFPVILQRPPGLSGPVPLPFAPQQPMNINQPLNNLMNPQMGQNVNQIGQSVNQIGQSVNQIGQNVNQFMQNSQLGFQNNQMMQQMHINQNQMMPNQLGQMHNNLGNQMGQNVNQMGQNVNHIGQNVNQIGQNLNPMGQNVNQLGQNVNHQMGQNINQMGQNVNQIGQGINQMMPNGNPFGQMNQFQHMMSQNRMMAPPPGIPMPRQNFSPNMGPFNHNFRGSLPKSNEPQSMMLNQQMMMKNQQINPIQPNHNQNSINQTIPPQNLNQMGQSVNQMGQGVNQMGQGINQMSQGVNQMGQSVNQMGQNLNQIPQNVLPQSMNQIPQNMNHMSQNMNQIPQNLSLSPHKGLKSDQKKSQTRTFNNKQLTSQNLVQLIQNTHPMLQFNSSFHNANHHPMLNRNNQFNNMNHPMLNQRHNGIYNNSNNRSVMNGDENDLETDEYAGLMSQREKQWLINIQMLQLNTGTPYIHDFYYTVFLERQAKKEKEGVKEAHKVNQQNHPFYSGGVSQESMRRERHNSNRHNSTSEDAPRTYVPTQFENSLGKLQCGSVTAPRKIIDVELVSEQQPQRTSRAPSVASTTNPAEVPREVKRTKQLLLDIEALYLILLRLEELNDPLAISNALILKEREEKQKLLEAAQKEMEDQEEDSNVFLKNIESVQRRPKQDSPKSETIDKRQVVNLAIPQKPAPVKNLLDEDKDELVNKMFMGLLAGDRLAQMLTVRKGRTLVSRFLCRWSRHARARQLWARAFRALPAVARRQDDGSLADLAQYYARYIESTTSWSPVLESCSLLSEALDPARTPYALTTAFTLTCVTALIEKATLLITSTTDTTSNERQWSKFLKTITRALKNTSLNVARPLKPMPEQKLTYHLKQVESRNTIEILQRGKPAEFADLSKNDVYNQLMKYLC